MSRNNSKPLLAVFLVFIMGASGCLGLADSEKESYEMAEIDLEVLSDYWEIELASVFLQREELNAVTKIPIPLPLPDLTEGPHLSYAVQWFIFMTIALIGYPLVLRKVSKETVQVT